MPITKATPNGFTIEYTAEELGPPKTFTQWFEEKLERDLAGLRKTFSDILDPRFTMNSQTQEAARADVMAERAKPRTLAEYPAVKPTRVIAVHAPLFRLSCGHQFRGDDQNMPEHESVYPCPHCD